MPKQGCGYTFHMGKWADHLLPYLDECASERGMPRPKLIQHILARVLGDRMIDELLGAYDPSRSPRGIVPVSRSTVEYPTRRPAPPPRSVNLFDSATEDTTEETRSVLPEPSRKTKFPPLPEPRPPRYISNTRSIGIPPQWHSREKTKNELRDELRKAVENTK